MRSSFQQHQGSTMTEVRLGVFSKVWRILAAATGLLAFAPDVFAQAAQQILSVAFVRVSLAEVPLSPWLTAGIHRARGHGGGDVASRRSARWPVARLGARS